MVCLKVYHEASHGKIGCYDFSESFAESLSERLVSESLSESWAHNLVRKFV